MSSTYKQSLIFGSTSEDFFKIYFLTFFIFALSFVVNLSDNYYFYIGIALVIDAGHVYSTFLESWCDPTENRKPYILKVAFITLALNLFVAFIFKDYFYYYIFYFTVYHNMRQGLGLVHLYGLSNYKDVTKVKVLYYISTMLPFLIFHLKNRGNNLLSQELLKRVEIAHLINYDLRQNILNVLIIIYFAYLAGTIFYIYKNHRKVLMAFTFFSFVYCFSFIFSTSEVVSYSLLILSHGIPYYFLFEKRVSQTHTVQFVRKYSYLFVGLFFLLGAYVDYNQDEIVDVYTGKLNNFLMAIFYFPLIAHFIYDSYIWTRENDRFQVFKINMGKK